MRSCGNREPSANMTGVATKRMPCEDGGRGQGASTCQGPQQRVLGQVPPHTSVWAPGSTPERTGSVLKPPSCGAWLWLPEPRLKPRKGGMEGADEGPGTVSREPAPGRCLRAGPLHQDPSQAAESADRVARGVPAQGGKLSASSSLSWSPRGFRTPQGGSSDHWWPRDGF